MDPIIAQDIFVSHSILNYLTASFQGRFAYLNTLIQLGVPGVTDKDLADTKGVLVTAANLTNHLRKGTPIFLAIWRKPESPDSKKIVELLSWMQGDLLRTSEDVDAIMSLPDLHDYPREVKILIAAWGRYAYSRENYLKGFVEHGKLMNIPDMVTRYQELHIDASNKIKELHELVAIAKKSDDQEPEFYVSLKDRCINLSSIFRTHAQDIIQLLSRFNGGMTYKLAGIPEEEAKEWLRLKAPPEIAGYWKAFRIEPEEAKAWLDSGILEPAAAADWKARGFDLEYAKEWVQFGFHPIVAQLWHKYGYSPSDSAKYIQSGITDPKNAPKIIQD